MRTHLFSLFVFALGVAGSSCTVDDSIVEGKECLLGTTNPDKTCMTGYECRCGDGKCTCVKAESLRQPLQEQLHEAARPPSLSGQSESDPSLLFLRRLGLRP